MSDTSPLWDVSLHLNAISFGCPLAKQVAEAGIVQPIFPTDGLAGLTSECPYLLSYLVLFYPLVSVCQFVCRLTLGSLCALLVHCILSSAGFSWLAWRCEVI